MSTKTFEILGNIDDVVFSTSWPGDEITAPTLIGPVSVSVNNGSEPGYARDLTISVTLFTTNPTHMERFTPGVSMFVSMRTYDSAGSQYTSGIFNGIVNEVTARNSRTRPGYIEMKLIGTDDKQRLNQGQLTTDETPRYPMGRDDNHPDREITGGLWTLDQLIKWNNPGFMLFEANDAAGNAWNDAGPDTTGYFPHKFGMSINNPISGSSHTDLISQAAKIMNLRCYFENGFAGFQAARFQGSAPWEIDSRYVSSDEGVRMKLYEWVNQWKVRYSRIFGNYVPNNTVWRTSGDITKYGVIEDFNDYEETIYEIHEQDDNIFWPNVGTFPLTIQELTEHRAWVRELQNRRNISTITVHLTKLVNTKTAESIGGFITDVFNIQSRRGTNPFIPSVQVSGELPSVALHARGIVEEATLTITPKAGRPPTANLELILGPGDGRRGTADPNNPDPIVRTWEQAQLTQWNQTGQRLWSEA